jgi:hypothetical protein
VGGYGGSITIIDASGTVPVPACVVGTAYTLESTVTDFWGKMYRCILAHTSTINDEPAVGINWETYWDLIECL